MDAELHLLVSKNELMMKDMIQFSQSYTLESKNASTSQL